MLVSYRLSVCRFDQHLQEHLLEYVHHLYEDFPPFLARRRYRVRHYRVYVGDFEHFVNPCRNHPKERMFPGKEKIFFRGINEDFSIGYFVTHPEDEFITISKELF